MTPQALLFLILLANFILPLTGYAGEKPYDYVIKGALVFDGESLRPIRQDIAISGQLIVQLGDIAREEATEVIEADGLVVSPGFIDIHTHSDFNPLIYPKLGNKILQGVTTEVVGNCGMSAAPVIGFHKQEIGNVWRREGVQIPSQISWERYEDYWDTLQLEGLETNFVGLVGHGNLRSAVMGMDPRPAHAAEIEEMKKILRDALQKGAWGVSFGLVYLPGISAAPDELVAICEEAAKNNGICAFHIRSEGKNLIEAIQEVIEIGKKAKAPIHISHLKAAGVNNWPKIKQAFQIIEQARAEGLRVTADAYPYTASFAELGVTLPDPLYQSPHRNPIFKDPLKRNRIVRQLERHYKDHPVSWDKIRIATVTQSQNFPLRGKSILEISEASKKTPVEVLVDLLREEEFQVSAFYFSQNESVVEEVLSKPYVAVGSDSIADGSAMPHPRAFGTFPKMLARCQKEGGPARNPCWGKTIRQMTGLPAKIMGLEQRGKITPAFFADLVIFDPASVQDQADYQNPKNRPKGIQWVFINGKPVVREGQYKPQDSGLFLMHEK